MLRSERSDPFRPVATVAPGQETTLEVAKPTKGAIPGKLSKPNPQLGEFAPGELVTVRTRNSLYRLIMLDPAGRKILIQGGRYLPCSTEACLLGDSSVLGVLAGGVDVGCSLQFVVGDRCFITSPIVEIEREGPNVRAA